ncbi:MAG: SIR2 family protein [Thermoguttaceae bacterium]|jgi:hypothetical protein
MTIQENRQKSERFLADLLLSENLIVFCGLGTSRCVKDSDGNVAAPTMHDLWEAAKKKAGEGFDTILPKVHYTKPPEGDNIEVLLSDCQLSQNFQPDAAVGQFITESERIIVDACSFVKDGTSLNVHELFLRKVARRSTRQPRLKLFTINYDLCFETAASRARFIVVDGFSHTHPQEFDGSHFSYDLVRRDQDRETPDYIPNVLHLYKIHGSLDWRLDGTRIIKDPATKKPHIIYPRYSKYESSYDQPFIEMMSRLQISLRQPHTGLVIVGFGFNDYHICQPLLSAIKANVNLKAIVVDPAIETSTKTIPEEIRNLIKLGDSRLALLAGGFEEFVGIIPDLVAATEEEKHRERLRKVGGVP